MDQDIEVVMLLCDSAETANGKLYLLGGGWSQIFAPDTPVSMSLAVKMGIPWDRANQRISIHAALVTDDGEPVLTPEGEAVGATGQIEVGRPPGLKPGEALDAPFVLNFQSLVLPAGGYEWRLTVGDEPRARAAFRVRYPPGAQPLAPTE